MNRRLTTPGIRMDATKSPDFRARLERLYGAAAAALARRLREQVAGWRERLAALPRAAGSWDVRGAAGPAFSERDVVLIAYPDHLLDGGVRPLATLAAWCRDQLCGCVSAIHLLPFHPSTSYEGYAITDYHAVDAALGDWQDVESLGCDFALMMDIVLNHCSSSHPWFHQFLAGLDPGRRYFIALEDPGAPWLEGVKRARNLPLLHPFETAAGTRHVWTTYSPDLIDLDWREPEVCLRFCDILMDAVAHGARILRLDAFVYTWKEPGTTCVAHPATHDLLRLFQDLFDAAGVAGVAILPSITNVPQSENYAYFGAGEPDRQADWIYHLPLSALILSALYLGDASHLRTWLQALPAAPPGRAYLNVTATHDGIGLTWLAGLLPEPIVRDLIEQATSRGSLLSRRRPTAGTGEELPWELNATYFDACAPEPWEPAAAHAGRFLATQSVMAALRGVPAFYLTSFLAGRNDPERVRETGDPRAINRGRTRLADWRAAAARPDSNESRVLAGLQRLLRARRCQRAFHPEGAQRVPGGLPDPLLAVIRTPPGERPGTPGELLCLTHLGATPLTLDAAQLARAANWPLDGLRRSRDVLRDGGAFDGEALCLSPYETRWLRLER